MDFHLASNDKTHLRSSSVQNLKHYTNDMSTADKRNNLTFNVGFHDDGDLSDLAVLGTPSQDKELYDWPPMSPIGECDNQSEFSCFDIIQPFTNYCNSEVDQRMSIQS